MAVKFSQFDGTITPVKTSETQFIVGFEGTTNAKWTMKALADEIGGGDNLYIIDGTLTGNRIVTQDGNQLSWDMGTGSQTFTTSSTSGTWMNLRVGGGQKGALLAVSGGGGMYFRDSGGSDYYNLSQNGFYLNRNAGFGITAQANQRLTIKGAGLTGSTYGLRVQNSDGEDVFAVRDDKYTTVTVNNGIENGFLVKNEATWTMLDTGDDGGTTPNSAQMRMYDNNNVRFYFKASQGLMVADTGNNGSSGASSVLTATSNTRGFLPPRNADPASNITTPVAGLVAYDTTDNKLQFYNGTDWTDAGGGGDNIYTADGNIPTATNRIVTLTGTATLAFYGAQNQGDFRIGYNQGGVSRGRSNYSIQQAGDVINTFCYQSNHYVSSNSDPLNSGYGAGINYLSVSAQGLEYHKVSIGVGINGTTNDRLVVKGRGQTTTKYTARFLDGVDNDILTIRDDRLVKITSPSGLTISSGSGGYGGTSLTPYSPTNNVGFTINNGNVNFTVGNYGCAVNANNAGNAKLRIAPTGVPGVNAPHLHVVTNTNDATEAVVFENSDGTDLLNMKENGRTSFSSQVKPGFKNSTSTFAFDWDEGNIQKSTATGAQTFSGSNAVAGSTYILIIGTPTVTWGSSVKWPGGTDPVLAGTTNIITLLYDGTSYYATSVLNYA